MGWAGQSDAWYNFDTNMPHGYEYIEDCVYNVYTTGNDEIISGRVIDASGDPITGTLVTAQRTAGGTYQAVTNSRGIYALAHLPSNSTYNISATKEGYSFTSQSKTNSISVDNTSVTGNIWAVNFTASSSSTHYVDTSAPGPTHDGTSWPTAFLYLQDALYAALSGDVIFVAEGVYRPDMNSTYPDGTYDRNASFQLKSGVAIYGGFPSGGCSGWTGRDIEGHETILSGDLNGDDGPVNDPCDLLTDPNRTENSYHVVTGSYTDLVARLDGFTITAGNANDVNWPNDSGAGMFNIQANCTVNKCTFIENSAEESGGAMWSTGSNLQASNCTFFRNFAVKGGGAMEFYICEHPVVVNCSFISNKGVFAGCGGGGIYVKTSSPDVINCLFVNNSTPSGAGMSNINRSYPTITNCTFYRNVATVSCGGISNYNGAYPIITNCILWENTAPQITDALNSGSTVNYTDVNGWAGAGFGNIDADPCFADPNGLDGTIGTLDDNCVLSLYSPCIDVGDNTAVPGGVHSDIDIRLRVADGDGDDREIVDMGASEFAILYLGDLNGDFKVNLLDMAILANNWLVEIP
jgi:predicted outer membrane repeat protein